MCHPSSGGNWGIVNPIVLSMMWAKCIGRMDDGLNLFSRVKYSWTAKSGSYFGWVLSTYTLLLGGAMVCQVGRIVVLNVAILPWKLESPSSLQLQSCDGGGFVCVCVCVCVCVSKIDFEKAFEARSTRSLFMAQKEAYLQELLFKSCQEESGYNMSNVNFKNNIICKYTSSIII
jgi:hypothetical protein